MTHNNPASPADKPRLWQVLPVLSGRLVELRPLVYEDAAGYLAAAHAGDDADQIFEHLSLPVPREESDARELIVAALAARASGERFAYAQIDRASGLLIGTTSYYEVMPSVRSLAIGHTWLSQPWWRTGHNTESKLLMLGHAFEALGAVRVVWHTDVRNARSQAAIERLGARQEGVLRKHRIRLDGSWRDTVQYAMTDEDWPVAKSRLEQALDRS